MSAQISDVSFESATPSVFDQRVCELGEGTLWHPERQQLFWFDILGKRLLTRDGGKAEEIAFDTHVSAAGWIDWDRLMVASETGLLQFELGSGRCEMVFALEADNPATRSNDGRADPWGGFWIGTMGKHAEPRAGAIYRYYRGAIRRLFAPISIPNAICFDPERCFACFADTPDGKIWRQPLQSSDGWPVGDPEVFIDLGPRGVAPDGAVIDRAGRLWNAQWGSGRIACYGADGQFLGAIAFPTAQTTCPAFGGPGLSTLFVASASEGMSDADRAAQPNAGMTFASATAATGQAEHRVVL
ncbi:MAG: SMP-30/gluconolactonase/LRE family protein [Pseudomonadota bacterium]